MLTFEWDVRKAERNERDHGVSFDVASLVFEDPGVLYLTDYFLEESRDWAIGRAGDGTLVVVHTVIYEDETRTHVRIISARRADRRERALYIAAQA